MQPLWKTVWRFLKKLKIELPYDPGVSLLGIYPRERERENVEYYSAIKKNEILPFV